MSFIFVGFTLIKIIFISTIAKLIKILLAKFVVRLRVSNVTMCLLNYFVARLRAMFSKFSIGRSKQRVIVCPRNLFYYFFCFFFEISTDERIRMIQSICLPIYNTQTSCDH